MLGLGSTTGNCDGSETDPKIRIVPGTTPPIVDPEGSEIMVSVEEIDAPPM